MLEGKVAIVTGAGRGLGRSEALHLAGLGSAVVVNDYGVAVDGSKEQSAAEQVVSEITAAGGKAVANGADVADWQQSKALVDQAIAEFGGLDIVVNNAGILRDRMIYNMSEDEWDAVIRVHLKGHYATARHACDHWRAESKAGRPVDARIINTSSGAGLQGSVGQSAYSAAKAGIAALTLVQAAELGRYGITSNAIAPSARTRMTEGVFADMMKKPESGFDAMAPENVSPLVVWLGSAESREVTGRVFEIAGGKLSLGDGWRTGETHDKGARYEPDEVGPIVRDLIAKGVPPQKVYGT